MCYSSEEIAVIEQLSIITKHFINIFRHEFLTAAGFIQYNILKVFKQSSKPELRFAYLHEAGRYRENRLAPAEKIGGLAANEDAERKALKCGSPALRASCTRMTFLSGWFSMEDKACNFLKIDRSQEGKQTAIPIIARHLLQDLPP